MKFTEDKFDFTRVHMVETDFELYHYKTEEILQVDMHYHDFFEVYLFLSGNVDYLIDGRTFHLKGGDILIINSKEMHKAIILSENVYERIVLFIRPEFIAGKSVENTNLLYCFNNIHKQENKNLIRTSYELHKMIKDNIVRIKALSQEKDFGDDLLKEAYLTELLIYLNRAYLKQEGNKVHEDVSYNPVIENLIYYINTNLQSDLSLDKLADKMFLSKYHLAREFKKNTGFTLHNFIHYKRMLTAKYLLRSGKSVTNVCYECGFSDYSNFIRAFKAEFGITPKQYAVKNRYMGANFISE